MTRTGIAELSLRNSRTNSAPLAPGRTWSVTMSCRSEQVSRFLTISSAVSAVLAQITEKPAPRSTSRRMLSCARLSSMTRTCAMAARGLRSGVRFLLRAVLVGVTGEHFALRLQPILLVHSVNVSAVGKQLIGTKTNFGLQFGRRAAAVAITARAHCSVRHLQHSL